MEAHLQQLSPLGPLVETHASWVFLGEQFVFKLKKPVDLGFLDYSTPEKRRVACEAEVRLNARLSPHTYLGVVPVKQEGEEIFILDPDAELLLSPRTPGEGSIIDYAVKMRRLPDKRRADVRLGQGLLEALDVDRMARVLAAFHGSCARTGEAVRHGSAPAILSNLKENFDQTRSFIGDYVSLAVASDIEQKQLAFLKEEESLIESRVCSGNVRDGHGDLRLEHVYLLPQGVEIIDCIEFNDRFRYADTCADLAFLSMDLRKKGRSDLAERLLSEYAIQTGDYDLYRLVDFYESYRAYVRGKVTAFLARQEAGPTRTSDLHQAAQGYFEFAHHALTRSSTRPHLLCVGGLIAAGKSTVAERLRRLYSVPIVDTDRTRRRMLGAASAQGKTDAPFQGNYGAELSAKVYDEVREGARAVLASGRSVIAEASFSKRADRERLVVLAEEMGAEISFIECWVQPKVAQKRLAERSLGPSVSDGRIEIYDAFVGAYEPYDETDSASHVRLDTSTSDDEQQHKLSQWTLLTRGKNSLFDKR